MRKRPSWAMVLLGAAALLGAVVAGTASRVGVGEAQQLPRPSGTPTRPVRTPAAVPTPIQASSREERLQRLQQERPGGKVYDVASETRGKPITVGKKTIALPADAYIEAVVTNVTCGVGNPDPCPETPAYVIRRGRSRIAISVNSGRISAETLVPGEEGAFVSLKEALK